MPEFKSLCIFYSDTENRVCKRSSLQCFCDVLNNRVFCVTSYVTSKVLLLKIGLVPVKPYFIFELTFLLFILIILDNLM